MNLFEDLIEELKEDNLLEDTSIDNAKVGEADQSQQSELPSKKSADSEARGFFGENTDNEELKVNAVETSKVDQLINFEPSDIKIITEDKTSNVEQTEYDIKESNVESSTPSIESANVTYQDETSADNVELKEILDEKTKDETGTEHLESEEAAEDFIVPIEVEGLVKSKPFEKPFVKEEFYRRRTLDQVNSLEMVEHVISGIEREQLKIVPNSFDDVDVKRALHEFLKVADDLKSPDHSKLEFNVIQKTENWTLALSKRDSDISIGHLRRYSETTKPSLSSHAYISLARFYRNSPFTEDVRSKFDFVITKLFTEDVEGEKRNLAFKPEELSQHIQELYADWSSTPLYLTEEEDSQLLLSALKFEDFMQEAENAKTFDELIKKDFFRRLKSFKEKTSENFFAPILVSAAINCNVVVGNRYIELLEENKKEGNKLGEKYGEVHDKSISDATSKTVNLLETLRKKGAFKEPTESKETSSKSAKKVASKDASDVLKDKKLFKASKWLVIATLITIILACAYLFLSNTSTKATNDVAAEPKNVKVVNLENSSLKEYVSSAKIAEGTLVAVSSDRWSKISFKEKQDVVEKFVKTGEDKDYSRVHIINSEGASVAFGSKDAVNIVE